MYRKTPEKSFYCFIRFIWIKEISSSFDQVNDLCTVGITNHYKKYLLKVVEQNVKKLIFQFFDHGSEDIQFFIFLFFGKYVARVKFSKLFEHTNTKMVSCAFCSLELECYLKM